MEKERLINGREIENQKIMTWIANTVDHSISMQFSKLETAKAFWDFLSNRYNQTNFALKYKLEMDIRNLKQQPGQSVSDFHLQMSVIWDQLALMEPKWTVDAGLYEQYLEETRLVQFLMALRDDFEGVSSSMFYHTPLPTVDSALAELIAEETRKGTTISPKPSYALCFCHTILEIRKSVPNPMQFLSEIWSHGQRLSKTLIQ